jgi:hypothetical protein
VDIEGKELAFISGNLVYDTLGRLRRSLLN